MTPTMTMTSKKRLAVFDLDHTLLPLDSDFSWGQFTTRLGWTDPHEFARRNEVFYAQYKAGTLDIHEYIRFATEAIRRQGPDLALAAREQYMDEVIAPAIQPQAQALLQRHRDAGEELLIITATNEFVTAPIAERLGVTNLIAVNLARGADGWITGEIQGVPSFREGKVTRLQDWLSARGLARDAVELTFYTDSINDLPLMDNADHPVATNPDDRLREVAQARGWPILELF
jgi:HAD superfamily hydrolase (TIGR01490 family)